MNQGATKKNAKKNTKGKGKKRARDDADSDGDADAKKQASSSTNIQRPVSDKDAAAQSAGYALELLSNTRGTRLFVTSALLVDDKISFWRYDPTGIVHTPYDHSILFNFDTVAVIILLLARSTPETLGALPVITGIHPPQSAVYPLTSLAGSALWLPRPDPSGTHSENAVEVTLTEHISSQYALCGRHTVVYRAEAKSLKTDRNLIIKLSFQPNRRMPEQDLVQRGLDRHVDHLPEIHLAGTLWTLVDIRTRAEAFFQPPRLPSPAPVREDRELRAVVYTEYYPLKPLFTKYPTLIPEMAKQILSCE